MSARISEELVRKLADEIRHSGGVIIPRADAEAIAGALKRENLKDFKVNLITPRRVGCVVRTDEPPADVRLLWCPTCELVYDANRDPNLVKSSRCKNCGRHLSPAPVYVVMRKGYEWGQLAESVRGEISIPILRSFEEIAGIPKPVRTMRITDRSRPLANLIVEGIRPRPIDRYMRYWYKLELAPVERMTRPVSISAFSYSPADTYEVKTFAPMHGIEGLLFCRKLEILQATVAFTAGPPRLGRHATVTFVNRDSNGTYTIPVRHFTTSGLIIKLDVSILRSILADDKRFRKLMHTVSHSFLVPLPHIVGLDARDFGEALGAHGEIAIYDNSPGGLGGVEGVVNNGQLEQNYEEIVRRAADCYLECVDACKACLYTDSCYMLNRNLDRHLLLSTLKWKLW